MKKQLFNRNWIFSATDRMAGKVLKEVHLPHDAAVEMLRDPHEAAGGPNGFFQEQNYVYEKSFTLPETGDNECVILEFEGIYHNSIVYINQAKAGRCINGYSGFYVDATQYLKKGQENLIRVVVKNGAASSRWYTGGGIYRNVNLLTSGYFHLSPDAIRLTAKDMENDLAVVQAEVSLENAGLGLRAGRLLVQLLDDEGKVAAEERIPVTVEQGERKTYSRNLYVANPELWDAEHPYLYQYRLVLEENGKAIDTHEGTYGIRKMQLDPRHGLRINGKTVNLRGGCIHHDNGIIGTAEFPHAEEMRIRTMKAAGYNAIRSAHNPISKTLLEVCDQVGMYIMDELTDVWNVGKVDFDQSLYLSEQWEELIARLVEKDYNHPSVIMYSIGNEIPDLGNPFNVQFGKQMADRFHHLDATRYVTNGINIMIVLNELRRKKMSVEPDGDQAVEPSEINKLMEFLGDGADSILSSQEASDAYEEAATHLDIVGYNYGACRYDEDQKEHPNWILVGSESYPQDLDRNWKLVEKHPNVIGDFSWSSWDYLGEAGIGQLEYDSNPDYKMFAEYPMKVAFVGDFNLIGDPRPVSCWRQILWGAMDKPYIAVQPPMHYGEGKLITRWTMSDAVRSWNFTGMEGKPVLVEVYADADEAELFVGGQSQGRQKVGEEKDYVAYFHTTYQPGEISVITYKNGAEVGRDVLKTAGTPHMEVSVDRNTIPADGTDLCYVDVFMRDENGVLNPEQISKVSIQVEGAGVLQGFGSADPQGEENYFDTTAKTFEGRLRAAIRSNGEKGEIKVLLTAENGDRQQVTILSK